MEEPWKEHLGNPLCTQCKEACRASLSHIIAECPATVAFREEATRMVLAMMSEVAARSGASFTPDEELIRSWLSGR